MRSDWVAARAQCLPGNLLQRIWSFVMSDAQSMNRAQDECWYDGIILEGGIFRLQRHVPAAEPVVDFAVHGHSGIRIVTYRPSSERVIKISANSYSGECELEMDGETYEVEELSQVILEPLFFPASDDTI